MYFKLILDEIGDSLNDTCLKSTGSNATRTKEAVNEFLFLDFLPLLDWDFLLKDDALATVNEYTTGTISLTQGSATVTGSGTTFTSAMVGRRILPSGSTRSYKITAYSSSTSITIESVYEGSTISGVSYSIAKDTFNLPRWIDDPKRIYSITDRYNNQALTQISRQEADRKFGARNEIGQPKYYIPSSRVRTLYSTGTVSATSATFVITGSSTAWTSSGLEAFDVIQVGSYVYTIKSIDSDTQITTVESIVTTISASTAYVAIQDRWTVELYPVPKNLYSYKVSALQLHPRLVNDTDVPLLPDNWHYILVKGARVKMMKHNQDNNYIIEEKELNAVLRRLTGQNNRETDRIERFAI